VTSEGQYLEFVLCI